MLATPTTNDNVSARAAKPDRPSPGSTAKRPRYDLADVKAAADGHWAAIINRLAGIDDDYLTCTHGSCPKCGGNDRWRVFDDFSETGGAICNQCGKFGDGLALLKWYLGIGFPEVVAKVAEFLGVPPAKPKPKKEPKKIDLEFLPDEGDRGLNLWCIREKNRLRTRTAVKSLGGRIAKHNKEFRVVAFPVVGESLNPDEPIGYILAETSEKPLPVKKLKNDEWEYAKYKVVGSGKGIILSEPLRLAIQNGENLSGRMIDKTEGISDLIAIISKDPNALAWTNAAGANQNLPKWVVDTFARCNVDQIAVIHDCDNPGQEGAAKCAAALATGVPDVRVIVLPFPMKESKGQDLRDWLVDHEPGELVAMFAGAARVEANGDAIDKKSPPKVSEKLDDLEPNEDPHDPARLARVNVRSYRENGGDLRYWHGKWWRYRRGCWVQTTDDEMKAKVRIGISAELVRITEAAENREDGTKPKRKPLTRNLVADVLDAMKSPCFLSSTTEMPCWLSDKSKRQLLSTATGIIDLDAVIDGSDASDSFIQHSPNWFSGTQVDYDFDSEAECPLWKQYLDTALPDALSQDLAQEWAGYLLTTKNPYQKFMAGEGEGGTGKSVYAAGLTAMLGEHSVSNADLEQFGTQFGLGMTIGKSLNVDSDVEKYARFSEGAFKKFVVGERMDFQLKGGNPFSQSPTAKVMLLWNERPRIKDSSNGFWRRMLLLSFERVIPETERIYGMDQPGWWRDSGELPGILNWAIEGLRRLSANRTFAEPLSMRKVIREYRADMNPVQAFLDDVVRYDSDSIVFTTTQSMVAAFTGWCTENASTRDAEAMNVKKMGWAIKQKFPTARTGEQRLQTGSRQRGFFGIELLDTDRTEVQAELDF